MMNAIEDLLKNFYRDGTRAFHPGKVIGFFIFLLTFIFFIVYNNARLDRRTKSRIENRRYTIGITGNIYHGIKNSQPSIKYSYTVLGRQYIGNQEIGAKYEGTVWPNGGRYFVEFSSKDVDNSKLLLDKPVPEYIQSEPDSGWIDIKAILKE